MKFLNFNTLDAKAGKTYTIHIGNTCEYYCVVVYTLLFQAQHLRNTFYYACRRLEVGCHRN